MRRIHRADGKWRGYYGLRPEESWIEEVSVDKRSRRCAGWVVVVNSSLESVITSTRRASNCRAQL